MVLIPQPVSSVSRNSHAAEIEGAGRRSAGEYMQLASQIIYGTLATELPRQHPERRGQDSLRRSCGPIG